MKTVVLETWQLLKMITHQLTWAVNRMTVRFRRRKLEKDFEGRKSQWKRNQRKYARTRGLSYVKACGQLVEEKQPILNGCICHKKCRLKCSDKFSSDERQALFDEFYALSSDVQQVQ